jgi:hypothetical protein
VTLYHDPVPLQLQIGAGHRVGVYQELLGQNANRRDFIPRRQALRSDEVLDLVGDLLIDRNSVTRGNVQLHCVLAH